MSGSLRARALKFLTIICLGLGQENMNHERAHALAIALKTRWELLFVLGREHQITRRKTISRPNLINQRLKARYLPYTLLIYKAFARLTPLAPAQTPLHPKMLSACCGSSVDCFQYLFDFSEDTTKIRHRCSSITSCGPERPRQRDTPVLCRIGCPKHHSYTLSPT